MTPDTSHTIDLIKKLLRQAESERTLENIEAAATFAAKASELLMQHKLEMTDLEIAAEDTDDEIINACFDPEAAGGMRAKRKRTGWLEALALAVTRAHFCRPLIIPGSRSFRIIGRTTDVEIVKYLLTVLTATGYRLSHEHWNNMRRECNRTGLPMPEACSRSFLVGFVRAIRERLTALRQAVTTQGGQFALVRFQSAELAVTTYINDAYADKNGKSTLGSCSGVHSHSANQTSFNAGYKAGSHVSLHGGLAGGGSAQRGTLTSGQMLLKGGK